jgi:gliding motility-associated-like protein
MGRKKCTIFFFALIVLFLSAQGVFAQQPYITYSSHAYVWYVGMPVSEAPTNTGGGPTNGYFAYLINTLISYNYLAGTVTILPGVTFNLTTGVISGTPATAWPLTTYKINAVNGYGESITWTFTIEVLGYTITFNALPNKTVCDADFSPGATSDLPLSFTSSNPAVATITNGMIHITGPGVTFIEASNIGNWISQMLTVLPSVATSITISPDSLDGCPDSSVTYMATATNGGSQPAYQWHVNGLNTGSNMATFSSNSLNNNDKITCTLTSNAPCAIPDTALSNTAIFTLTSPIIASVNITSPVGAICANSTVTFAASVNTAVGNLAYQWQVDGKNAGTNSPIFTTKNLSNDAVVACILTVTGKCTLKTVTSNLITINLSPESGCEITIPNTFTPNGDGINDYWDISLLPKYKNCTVTIFSRYGTVVYNSIGYAIPWDGTYNGKQLPVGTYYYVIDLKTGGSKLAGSVAIIR